MRWPWKRKQPDEEKTTWWIVDWQRPPILVFDEPDQQALADLRKVLAGMDVVPFGDASLAHICSAERVTHRGNLDEVMRRLAEVLGAGYADLMDNPDEWAGDVCRVRYGVRHSEPQPGAIHVLTKLYCPGEPGAISYGHHAQRVADDEYWIWAAD